MICQICQTRIFDGFVAGEHNGQAHLKFYNTFKCSVGEGCYIGNRILAHLGVDERRSILQACERENNDGLPDHEKDYPRDISIEYLLDSSGHNPGSFLSITICLTTGGPPVNCPDISICLRISKVSGIQTTLKLANTTQSIETFSLAKSWISQCEEAHEYCTRFTDESWYPTRLIDCGVLMNSELCRMVESGSGSVTGPYMTLSHCWGKVKSLELTAENYNQLLDTIPLSSLPRLYQDAIYTTRQLNIRYLWIDSLCIIQSGDNLKDWQHEVSLMSKVYSNSFCNISAGAAPDAEHSMFNIRNPIAIVPGIVDLAVPNSPEMFPHLISDEGIWDVEVSSALINSRAWVLQERLLSTRNLHFGESQLSWECRQKDASEIYPAGLPEFAKTELPRVKSLFTLRKQRPSGETLSQSWYNIVTMYSSCNLTYPSDKLVALSAVAKEMKFIMGDQYVVGLWRRDLERQLLWVVKDPALRLLPEVYRAPSWSWAALDGKVSLEDTIRDSDIHIRVEDLDIQYVTDDDTGQVLSGWLQLRGHLRPVELQYSTYGYWWVRHIASLTNVVGQLWLDHLLESSSASDNEVANRTYYCMPANFTHLGKSAEVLLLRVVDAEKGIFRRIGIWTGWHVSLDNWNLYLACQEGEESYPCEEYRDGHHYIRII